MLLLPDAAPWRQWGRSGWIAVARHLLARDLAVVSASDTTPGMDAVTWFGAPDLRHPWRLVIGVNNPDTWAAVSAGLPTVAILGPDASPLDDDPARAGVRRVGDTWLVQSRAYCVPCGRRGCNDAVDSPALCLDWLAARRVVAAVEQALELPRRV